MKKGKRLLALFLAFAMIFTSVNLDGWATVKAADMPEKLAYFSFEEDAVEFIVVILTGMHQDRIEILVALFDHFAESYDLRSRSDNDHQFQFSHIKPPHGMYPVCSCPAVRLPTSA